MKSDNEKADVPDTVKTGRNYGRGYPRNYDAKAPPATRRVDKKEEK